MIGDDGLELGVAAELVAALVEAGVAFLTATELFLVVSAARERHRDVRQAEVRHPISRAVHSATLELGNRKSCIALSVGEKFSAALTHFFKFWKQYYFWPLRALRPKVPGAGTVASTAPGATQAATPGTFDL